MTWNQIPAVTFAIALSFFTSVYAISASGAWSSVGQWIAEYQILIFGMTSLLVALTAGIFAWRRFWGASGRQKRSLREFYDGLRSVNNIKDACSALRVLILGGIANELAVLENPAAYFDALRRCDMELAQFRRLVAEIPQSAAKQPQLQFIQTCDGFLDIARQIAPGGHVDFTRYDPNRPLQFNLRLEQWHDSLIQKSWLATELLGDQIRGMDALLFDRNSRPSAGAQVDSVASRHDLRPH